MIGDDSVQLLEVVILVLLDLELLRQILVRDVTKDNKEKDL